MYKYISHNENDTIELAENIESEKFPNMVICLNGELGTGKTVFTKGFANSLEVDEDVTSPTFNIIKEYTSGEMPLYHIDVYRIENNVEELGLDEYFHKGGIVIIEWAELIEDYLPENRLELSFKTIEDEDERVIYIKPYGKEYEDLCEAIL